MIKINLLPKEARKHVGVVEQLIIMGLVVIVTLVGIGLYWSYLNGQIEQKQQEIKKTKDRLAELQKVIDEIKKFEKQRTALENKLKIIVALEKDQQIPVHFLDNLYLSLVDDMWLKNFAQAGSKLTLSGSALSNPVVAAYLKSLESSVFFENVELIVSSIRRVADREVRDFQISATLRVPPELFEKKPQEGGAPQK